MQEKPKFCKDCKHFTFARHCKHPNNGFDLVTGESRYEGADYNRKDDSLCGEAAKWFEIKPLVPKPEPLEPKETVPPPTTETMYKSGGVYSNNQAVEEKPWYKFWK